VAIFVGVHHAFQTHQGTMRELTDGVEREDAVRKGVNTPDLRRSFWALADQGVLSIGNFATAILMARALPQAAFGTYVLLLGILLFLNIFHLSLVANPLLIEGATRSGTNLQVFATTSITLVAIGVSPLCAVASLAALMLHQSTLIPWIVAGLFFWQIQETTRRVLLSQFRHREALWGDALSYLGQGSLLWLISREGRLTIQSVFVVIALTSAAAAVVQSVQIRLAPTTIDNMRNLGADFWRLGRWMLLTSIVGFLTLQAFPWIVGIRLGVEDSASFQAVATIVGVFNPVLFGVTNLVVVAAARAHRSAGVGAARHIAAVYGLQGIAFLMPCCLILIVWPRAVLTFLYGADSPYQRLQTDLRLFTLAYLLVYIASIYIFLLGALGQSRAGFLAQFVGAVTVIVTALPLLSLLGLHGAVLCISFSAIVRGAIGARFVMRL